MPIVFDARTQELLEKALKNERIARELLEKKLEDKNKELEETTLKLAMFADELSLANLQMEHDLDERKRLESQLVQIQKMESLGQLAAGVAHEINNPISFVTSNVSTVKEYLTTFIIIFEQLDVIKKASQEKDILMVQQACMEIQKIWKKDDMDFILSDIHALTSETQEGLHRVKEIVQNLKSFARLDESEFNEANLNECIESTIKLAWNELKYKCEIKRNYGEIPLLACSAGQLNQVFMNLIVNAAQAINKNGIIEIETKTVKDKIIIRITDSGEGIPPENIKKLFDPFFTTKPVGSGTGLGLSISYSIIKRHHGDISVTSEMGKGTTFTITLPLPKNKGN